MKTLLIILAFFLASFSYAQDYREVPIENNRTLEISELKLNYPIVFEGEVLSKELSYIDKGGSLITPFVVKITRIFKGNEYIQLGSIQIVRGGGQ